MATTSRFTTTRAHWLAILVVAAGCHAGAQSPTPNAMSRARATSHHACGDVHACERACNRGEGGACTSVAAYYEAEGTPASFSRARASYARACDLESGSGCVGAAAYEIDDLVAAGRLRAGCKLGDRLGCSRLNRLTGAHARSCKTDALAACDANVSAIAARRTAHNADIPTVDAENRLSRACTAGVFRACQVRGRLVATGKLRVRSAKRKVDYLELACVAQEPIACKALGAIYLSGTGIQRDTSRARVAFDRACRHGDPGTCRSMGSFIMNSEDSTAPDDAAIAAHLYERGCTQGHLAACLDFGRQLQLGNGITRDRKRAARVFEKACVSGETRACTLAADLYGKGWGASFSPDKAAKLYRKACKASDGGACRKLSRMYRSGRGVKPDMARAHALLQRACVVGSPTACDEVKQGETKSVAQ